MRYDTYGLFKTGNQFGLVKAFWGSVLWGIFSLFLITISVFCLRVLLMYDWWKLNFLANFRCEFPAWWLLRRLSMFILGFVMIFGVRPLPFFTSNIHALLKTIYDIVDCCFWNAFFLKMNFNVPLFIFVILSQVR